MDNPADPPCAVADALDRLYADPDNRDAWRLWQQINQRLLADTHGVPMALERLTADLDAETFADRIARLALLYDVLCPPKTQSRES